MTGRSTDELRLEMDLRKNSAILSPSSNDMSDNLGRIFSASRTN